MSEPLAPGSHGLEIAPGSSTSPDAAANIEPAQKEKEIRLVEGGQRPVLHEAEREDASQVIALAIAGAQRERASADQYYLRGRNLLALVAALFTAVQAAFLANIGRQVGSEVLLTSSERGTVLIPTAIAVVFLAATFVVLFGLLDRGRDKHLIGADALTRAWLDPTGEHKDKAVLEVLAARAIQEESEWADANRGRKGAFTAVSWLGGLTGAALVAELAVLYIGLA